MILGVVIKYKDILIALPKPNRHMDCVLHGYCNLGYKDCKRSKISDGGFYTKTINFMDRVTALEYAKEHNQLINKQAHTMLFSEDLW